MVSVVCIQWKHIQNEKYSWATECWIIAAVYILSAPMSRATISRTWTNPISTMWPTMRSWFTARSTSRSAMWTSRWSTSWRAAWRVWAATGWWLGRVWTRPEKWNVEEILAFFNKKTNPHRLYGLYTFFHNLLWPGSWRWFDSLFWGW